MSPRRSGISTPPISRSSRRPAACSRWMSGSVACPSRGSRDEPSGERGPNRRDAAEQGGKVMFVKSLVAAVAALAFGLLSNAAMAAGPQVVAGPGAEPACFAPWGKDVKYFQWPKKAGPYRIAVVNGFVANVWRIQMIKTAKAYAAVP